MTDDQNEDDQETSFIDTIHHSDDAVKAIKRLNKDMKQAAKQLDFEEAAKIRDQIKVIKGKFLKA